MERAAHVESARAVAGDAPRVADGRCETSLHETVNQNVVAGVAVGGYGVPKESQELVAKHELHVVVQPTHDAHPEALEPEPWVEGATRAADPELVFRNKL